MNNKHRKTLKAICESPVRADIVWKDIEAMFVAFGGAVSEAAGSRVELKLNGVKAVFHRPHPRKETDKGAVKTVRKFLDHAGVEYDGI
jgi:hypothetical protein